MIGAINASAVATLVERFSRYTLVVPLCDGYSADNVACAVTAALWRQPAELAKTLSWDQGSEMARWADIDDTPSRRDASAIVTSFRNTANTILNLSSNDFPDRRTTKSLSHIQVKHQTTTCHKNLDTRHKLHNWKPAAHIYTMLCRNHR